MEEVYAEMIEESDFPMIIADKNDEIVMCNEAARIAYDLPKEVELKKYNLASLFADGHYSALKDILQKKRKLQEVTHRLTAKGTSLFVHSSMRILEKNNYIFLIDQIINDKLKLSEVLHLLVNTSPDAVIVSNEKGYICYSNKNAETLFGYGSNELDDKHLNLLIPERFHQSHDKHLESYFKEYHVRPMGSGLNIFGIRKNKEEFPADICLSPLDSPDEKLVIAAIRDLTEKKKTEKQLIEQKELLEQANEELEQFVYVASHDLKEPVNSIMQYITMILDSPCGKKFGCPCYNNMEGIQKNATRLSELVNDLLMLARIGRETREIIEVDVENLVEEILNDLKNQIDTSHAKVKITTKLPIIKCVESGLRLLIQNLISNAIKYVSSGKTPCIEISCEEKNDEWQFSFKDCGIGIDDKYFEKIFLPFQRLHQRSEYEGTGIGLAHCKKIIDLHQGKIWLTSEKGKGTTFFFTIPKEIDLS